MAVPSLELSKEGKGVSQRMKKISIILLSLLIILSMVACSSPSSDTAEQETKNDTNQESDPIASETEQEVEESSPDNEPTASVEVPRTNIPLYPDAEFLGVREYSKSISEVYATDASVTDAIAFYGESSHLESKSTDTYTDSVGNFYYHSTLLDLMMKEESLQEELKASGPLLQIWIAPSSDTDALRGVVGSTMAGELPDDKTIIVLTILTDY